MTHGAEHGHDQQEREGLLTGHIDAFLRQLGMQREYCRKHGLSARELRKWRTRFCGPVRQLATRLRTLLGRSLGQTNSRAGCAATLVG
jgi:hypothetical protein